jgi:hypothetical protein
LKILEALQNAIVEFGIANTKLIMSGALVATIVL